MALYRVSRLQTDSPQGRRYHLFDASDQLLLVIDDNGSAATDDAPHQARLSTPDGGRVATLDFPTAAARPGKDKERDKEQPHALMVEHAVYALVTTIADEPLDFVDERPSCIRIEVQGKEWVGLCAAESDDETQPLLLIYDAEQPAYDPTEEPVALGDVRRSRLPAYDLEVMLPSGALDHAALLAAAIALLVDAHA